MRGANRAARDRMKDKLKVDYTHRLSAAAEAKKALLEKFKPKPAAPAGEFESRVERRAADLARVRQARAEAREAALKDREQSEHAVLEARRAERKERKALTKSEQKARRDAKYAARKARQR